MPMQPCCARPLPWPVGRDHERELAAPAGRGPACRSGSAAAGDLRAVVPLDGPAAVASTVRRMLAPDGACVHVHATTHQGVDGDDSLPHPRPPRAEIKDLIDRVPRPVRRAGRARCRPVRQVMSGRCTSGRVSSARNEWTYLPGRVVERTTDDVVASIFSLSSAAPHLFGDAVVSFERDLRSVLERAAPGGGLLRAHPRHRPRHLALIEAGRRYPRWLSAACWTRSTCRAPPRRVADVVMVATRTPVDHLADDVGVAGVLGGLRHDADQQRSEGGVPPLLRPPRHLRGSVQPQLLDRLVGVPPGGPVQVDEVLPGLVGRRPHVSAVPDRLVLDPGQPDRSRTAHGLAQVADLDPGEVLDESQQIRGGRRHGPADVVLGQAVQGPQHAVPRCLEVAVQVGGQARADGGLLSHAREASPA